MILGKTLLAGFLAAQAGLLVASALLMVTDAGLSALPQAGIFWARMQLVFIPVALLITPVCAAIRYVLGPAFLAGNRVALMSGAGIGFAVAAGLLLATEEPLGAVSFRLLAIGATAGFVGGWVWWLFEKPRGARA